MLEDQGVTDMSRIKHSVPIRLLVFAAIISTPALASADTPPASRSRVGWKRQIEKWARGHAEENIRAIRDPGVLKTLETVLLDEEQPYAVQMACIEALSSFDPEQVIRTFVKAAVLGNRDLVRDAAIKWLRQLENREEAIPFFVDLVRAPKSATRAASALMSSGLVQRLSTEMPDQRKRAPGPF